MLTEHRQGPLATEKRQRTVTRQTRITKNKEDLVQPQQVIMLNTFLKIELPY